MSLSCRRAVLFLHASAPSIPEEQMGRSDDHNRYFLAGP